MNAPFTFENVISVEENISGFHGKKAEIQPWHTQDPKKLSPAETSITKIRQARFRL